MENRQQLSGINNEAIDRNCRNPNKIENKVRPMRDIRKETLKTLRRRWGAPLAKRIDSDPSCSLYMMRTMNKAWNTCSDRRIAFRRLNSVIAARLLNKKIVRAEFKVRAMTTKDWMRVCRNEGNDEEDLSYKKLSRIKMHLDDFGILVEGPPKPIAKFKKKDEQIVEGTANDEQEEPREVIELISDIDGGESDSSNALSDLITEGRLERVPTVQTATNLRNPDIRGIQSQNSLASNDAAIDDGEASISKIRPKHAPIMWAMTDQDFGEGSSRSGRFSSQRWSNNVLINWVLLINMLEVLPEVEKVDDAHQPASKNGSIWGECVDGCCQKDISNTIKNAISWSKMRRVTLVGGIGIVYGVMLSEIQLCKKHWRMLLNNLNLAPASDEILEERTMELLHHFEDIMVFAASDKCKNWFKR